MRHNRRTTKKISELPSLFSEEEIYGDTPAVKTTVISSPVLQEAEDTVAPDPSELKLGEEFRHLRKKLRFMSFGSGSSGNCSYIGTSDCGLLIDAGIDSNFVLSEMARNGIDARSIRGIILTHDHGDHVKYAYNLVKRQPKITRPDGTYSSWQIFATPRTIEGILRRHNLSRRIRDYHTPIYKEHEYVFGDMRVIPFETSHDGSDNMGFSITLGDIRFVICTDTGVITQRADFYLRQATSIMLESNYDNIMLERGRYPEYLKARIRSQIGHLDNVDASQYIASTFRPSIRHLFLCHLSEENNTPKIALQNIISTLRGIGVNVASTSAEIAPGSPYVTALPRYRSSELFIL